MTRPALQPMMMSDQTPTAHASGAVRPVPSGTWVGHDLASPGQSSAEAGAESGRVLAIVIASRCSGNFVGQIPLGGVAFHPMMAAHKIECADEATVAPTIVQAASDPALA